MTITVPENVSDITLGQFIKYEELQQRTDLNKLNTDRRKISIFTGIPYKDTIHINNAVFERLLSDIDTALNSEVIFTDRFTMHDIEFGFIPDFDKITIGEYADLSQYTSKAESRHRVMAVLFRPIIKRDGEAYKIMPYNGTDEYAEMMKGMPLNCATGALVFFYSLANELQKATQKYLTEAILRANPLPNTSKLSGGLPRLSSWLKEIFSRRKIKCRG